MQDIDCCTTAKCLKQMKGQVVPFHVTSRCGYYLNLLEHAFCFVIGTMSTLRQLAGTKAPANAVFFMFEVYHCFR